MSQDEQNHIDDQTIQAFLEGSLNSEDAEQVIRQFLDGHLSPKDTEQVAQHLFSFEKYIAIYHRITDWNETQEESEEAFERFTAYLNQVDTKGHYRTPSRKISLIWQGAIAATITILIGIAGFLFFRNKAQDQSARTLAQASFYQIPGIGPTAGVISSETWKSQYISSSPDWASILTSLEPTVDSVRQLLQHPSPSTLTEEQSRMMLAYAQAWLQMKPDQPTEIMNLVEAHAPREVFQAIASYLIGLQLVLQEKNAQARSQWEKTLAYNDIPFEIREDILSILLAMDQEATNSQASQKKEDSQ